MSDFFKDIELVCVCGKEFVWTSGEQGFLQGLVDDGKTNYDGSPVTFAQPKRCSACRTKKRQEREKKFGK